MLKILTRARTMDVMNLLDLFIALLSVCFYPDGAP